MSVVLDLNAEEPAEFLESGDRTTSVQGPADRSEQLESAELFHQLPPMR